MNPTQFFPKRFSGSGKDRPKNLTRPGLLALLALSIVFFVALSAAADVAVIGVGYRDVLEMLPLVETLIAPGGKVSADQRTNSLAVVADAASIDRVRDFLASMDKPVPQAVVRVRFDDERSAGDRSLSASGRVSGDDWSAGTTGVRREGERVRVQDRSISGGGRTEAMLRIMSGSMSESGIIRFSEAATRMTVPLGQWTTIGGTSQATDEAVSAILSTAKRSQHQALTMSVLVEAQSPDG